MNTLGKTLIAVPALTSLCVLFCATTPVPEVMLLTGEAEQDVELADGAETVFRVQVDIEGLPQVDGRPEWVDTTMLVSGENARRSTLLRDHSNPDVEPVRLRDGLTIPFDLDARCPDEGLCTFDVPLRLDSRRDDDFSLSVQASVGILDWDYHPRDINPDLAFSFDDLDVQVSVVEEGGVDD